MDSEPLTDSPVDFQTAVAYALQPTMRRLVIVYLVGGLLLSTGTTGFLGSGISRAFEALVNGLNVLYFTVEILQAAVSLLAAIVGAALLFGGLIGALFKIVVDANRVAAAN